MPIPVVCPKCATRLNAPDNKSGRRAKCPKCGATIMVPGPTPDDSEPGHSELPLRGEQPTKPRDNAPPLLPVQHLDPTLDAIVPGPRSEVETSAGVPSDFITLNCPSCGGSLKVTGCADQFVCKYCGKEHVIRRHGNTISVAPVVEKLDRIVTGVDRQASELAIVRLEKEIQEMSDRIKRRDFVTQPATTLLPHPTTNENIAGVALTLAGLIAMFSVCCGTVDKSWMVTGMAVAAVIAGLGFAAMIFLGSAARTDNQLRRHEELKQFIQVREELKKKQAQKAMHLDIVRR